MFVPRHNSVGRSDRSRGNLQSKGWHLQSLLLLRPRLSSNLGFTIPIRGSACTSLDSLLLGSLGGRSHVGRLGGRCASRRR